MTQSETNYEDRPVTIASLHALGYVGPDQAVVVKDFGEGMFAAVVPRLYTWRIIYGSIDNRFGFDRFWCYERLVAAIVALAEWTDDTLEPAGWVKADDGRRHGEPLARAAGTGSFSDLGKVDGGYGVGEATELNLLLAVRKANELLTKASPMPETIAGRSKVAESRYYRAIIHECKTLKQLAEEIGMAACNRVDELAVELREGNG